MRRSWQSIDFESVRNQSALVCNCRHEELVQLLEVDFVQLLNGLPKSSEPVGEVMVWADGCCERLMGGGPRGSGSGLPGSGEERSTLSSRSILIRWGYVTSQIMRDLVSLSIVSFPSSAGKLMARLFFLSCLLVSFIVCTDDPQRPGVWRFPDPEAVPRVSKHALPRSCSCFTSCLGASSFFFVFLVLFPQLDIRIADYFIFFQ